MADETLSVVDAALRGERAAAAPANSAGEAELPVGDYTSPGLVRVRPDHAFPFMRAGDKQNCQWQYLRREVPHNWYVDGRVPAVGFLSRDEAAILHNSALQFRGKRALEIGCFLGWSACHLALAGVRLDTIDPLLGRADFRGSVEASLGAAGVLGSVRLVAGGSPDIVPAVAGLAPERYSLIFIDGNSDGPAPLQDAVACEPFAAEDAMVLFHDLAAPDVAAGLDYYRCRGWNTRIYHTMQIIGVAWRGRATPVDHTPDPAIHWPLPAHLARYETCQAVAAAE